jgi:hypothetical protein
LCIWPTSLPHYMIIIIYTCTVFQHAPYATPNLSFTNL